MKKTYVIQFDYDESEKKMTEVFHVTLEQVEAVKALYLKLKSRTKSASLITLLDSGEDIPGGS